jgi:hypothetical protein
VLFEGEIGDQAGVVAVIHALIYESCPGASNLAGETSLGCHENHCPALTIHIEPRPSRAGSIMRQHL